MNTFNLNTLSDAAKANDCELTLSQQGGTNFFTIGNVDMGYVEFSNYSTALSFLTNNSNRPKLHDEYEFYLEGLSKSEVLKAPSREEFYRSLEKQSSVKLATMGECLEATAKNVPCGYIRFTGTSNAFCGAGFTFRPITAAISPAPVQIYIASDTPTVVAREILIKVAKWLRDNKLPSMSSTAVDYDPNEIPF